MSEAYYTYAVAEAYKDTMIDKRAKRKDKMMTARQWVNNDAGSADPRNSTFEAIFDAYHDYRNSQQWN